MAETFTNSVTLTLQYSDFTSRSVTFSNVDDTALANVKRKAKNFNAALDDGTSTLGAAYKETFVSNDGAPLVKIGKASYTEKGEEVLYGG